MKAQASQLLVIFVQQSYFSKASFCLPHQLRFAHAQQQHP
jgi:hypothetical protein